MKRLIYHSLCSDDFDSKAIAEMLKKAILHNKEKSITGMLVYDGLQFIQCIEGEPSIIDELLIKIQIDSRHHSLSVIGTEEDEERLFSAWDMGYISYNEKTKEVIHSTLGYDNLYPETLTYEATKLLLQTLSKII